MFLPKLEGLFSKTIFQDRFQSKREALQGKENPGNGWGTNSKTRAKGEKQVFLRDNAMYHQTGSGSRPWSLGYSGRIFSGRRVLLRGLSCPEQGDLGVNIADMTEASVHAGHICMARIKPASLEIVDLKTGRMRKEMHEKSKAKKLTKAEKKQIATKSSHCSDETEGQMFGMNLQIVINGDVMSVKIDGRQIGRMASPGIGHKTKRRIRLAVNTEAWVDDVMVAVPE